MANLRFLVSCAATLWLSAAPALAHDPDDGSRYEEGQGVDGAWDEAPLSEDADPRALTEFRSALDPHGEWYQHPEFGLVWVPSRKVVGDAFVPYVSRGRWALDMQGNWVWQSDYPFGWVVFHHGRWVDVPGIGWAWIPGYLYSPAWVVWGSPAATIAYVGWAPMGPSFIWVDGVAVVAGGEWSPYWVFCRSHYAFSPRVHLHVVKSERRHEYLSRRTVPREAPRPTYRWYAPFGRGSDRGASSGDTGSPEVTGAGGAGGAGRTAGATAASRRELSERVERRARAPRALDSPGAARVGSVPGAANRTPPKPRVRVDEGLHVERKVGDAPRALRQSPSARSSGPGRRAVPPRARLQAKPAKLRPKRTLQPVPARPKRTLEPAPARPKKGE